MRAVVHVIETLGPGGAERLLHTNLRHLDRARFSSSVVTLRAEGDHFRAPIEALGVPVTTLGVNGRLDLPAAALRLKRLLSHGPADLVHSHLWEAHLVSRISGRLAGVPVVSSIHGPDHDPETWRAGRQGRAAKRHVFRALDRSTARFGCSRLIAVSESLRRSVHAHLGFPLDRIDVVYNPVELDDLRRPPARDRSAVLAGLGLPGDGRILLSVARLSPQKGLHHAIEALPRILRADERAYLVSVGSLDHREWHDELRRRCAQRGVEDRVRFLGPRRDVFDLLRACDLFLFPSLFEGLGIALLEAMAAGCACIASDLEPIREIVRHGVDGWLVPPGDEEALARAVIRALENDAERRAVGRAAAETAASRFDPRDGARRLQEVYERVLSGS